MSLQWREQLSVGNDLIDDDHKYLIDIVNQAEQSWKAKNRANLVAVLDRLSEYSKSHFSKEESIAAAAGYPGAMQLHETHEELVNKLDQFKQEIGEEWTESSGEHLNAFLRDWLISHVIKEDMLMKPFLKKLSPKFDPRLVRPITSPRPKLLPQQADAAAATPDPEPATPDPAPATPEPDPAT
jgi:hemerythrin